MFGYLSKFQLSPDPFQNSSWIRIPFKILKESITGYSIRISTSNQEHLLTTLWTRDAVPGGDDPDPSKLSGSTSEPWTTRSRTRETFIFKQKKTRVNDQYIYLVLQVNMS